MGGECFGELFAVSRTVGGKVITVRRAKQIRLRVSRQTLVAMNRRVDVRKRRQGISQVGVEEHYAVRLRKITEIGRDARNDFLRPLARSRAVLRDILIKGHQRRARAVAENNQFRNRRETCRGLELFEVLQSRFDARCVLLVTVVTVLASVEYAVGTEGRVASGSQLRASLKIVIARIGMHDENTNVRPSERIVIGPAQSSGVEIQTGSCTASSGIAYDCRCDCTGIA